MDNFDFKKYLAEGKLLKEAAPELKLPPGVKPKSSAPALNLPPGVKPKAPVAPLPPKVASKPAAPLPPGVKPKAPVTKLPPGVKPKTSLPPGVKSKPPVDGKPSLNEGVLDFTFEELGMLRDGLDWIVEYQEGVAPDSYIADVKRLAMKLDKMALQR